jgi:hypothetical protein
MKTLAFGEGSMKSSTIGTNVALEHAQLGHVQVTRYAGGLVAGVFSVSPALWAGSSDTSQEINLNYRDAPPWPENGVFVRRGAALLLNWLIIGVRK